MNLVNILTENDEILSPRKDLVFKSLFTRKTEESKGAFLDFLSGILKKEVIDVTINENELAVNSTNEKQSTMDINCKCRDGEILNIEMQVEDKGVTGIRAEYNVAKLHGSQGIKGRDYSELNRTIQVTITDYSVYSDEIYIDEFTYTGTIGRKLIDSKTSIFIIELSKLSHLLEKPTKSLTKIEKWALYLKYVDDVTKRDFINSLLKEEVGLAMASSVLKTITNDELFRMELISKEKAAIDREADLIRAKREGREEGETNSFLLMISNGLMTYEKLSTLNLLSKKQLRTLREQLAKE